MKQSKQLTQLVKFTNFQVEKSVLESKLSVSGIVTTQADTPD